MEGDVGGHFAWHERYIRDLQLAATLEMKVPADPLATVSMVKLPADEQLQGPAAPFLQQRLDAIRAHIGSLADELTARRELHERHEKELEFQIQMAAFSLGEFKFWGVGFNRGVDMKRNLLERQLADLRHKRRQAQIRLWEDATALRRQVRDLEREYAGVVRQARAIGGE